MADVIDAANERAAQDLANALSAARRRVTGPTLWPARVCHNCGEPLDDGNALWCAYVEPGESRPACAIDYSRRMGR